MWPRDRGACACAPLPMHCRAAGAAAGPGPLQQTGLLTVRAWRPASWMGCPSSSSVGVVARGLRGSSFWRKASPWAVVARAAAHHSAARTQTFAVGSVARGAGREGGGWVLCSPGIGAGGGPERAGREGEGGVVEAQSFTPAATCELTRAAVSRHVWRVYYVLDATWLRAGANYDNPVRRDTVCLHDTLLVMVR